MQTQREATRQTERPARDPLANPNPNHRTTRSPYTPLLTRLSFVLTCRWWWAACRLSWWGCSIRSWSRCFQSDPSGIQLQLWGVWNPPGSVPPTATTPETRGPQQQWLQLLKENKLSLWTWQSENKMSSVLLQTKMKIQLHSIWYDL